MDDGQSAELRSAWTGGAPVPIQALLVTGEQLHILSLPAHRGVDAIASAGVIEKNPLLDWARIHLAVFAQMDRSLGKAIGLPARVQAIHVGFVFLSACKGVRDGRGDETKD